MIHLSLSRLNHWLPGGEAHPEIVQSTAEFHHQIADAFLPQADPVFDAASAQVLWYLKLPSNFPRSECRGHPAIDVFYVDELIAQGLGFALQIC